MESISQLVLFVSVCIGLVVSECPPEPRKKAAECGKVFSNFGRASPDVQRHLCPGVREAVSCLVNLMTNCPEFQAISDPVAFKNGILPLLEDVCPLDVIEEKKERCNRKTFALMMNQCSDLALQDYRARHDVCRYVIQKSNCMENVFDECRNLAYTNTQSLDAYEKDLEKHRNECKRGQTPVMMIKVDDGYVNDSPGGTNSDDDGGRGKMYHECQVKVNDCVALSQEPNKHYCRGMKQSLICMEDLLKPCEMVVADVISQPLNNYRRDYYTSCVQNKNKVKPGEAIDDVKGKYDSNKLPVSDEESIFKGLSRDRVTESECRHLIKLCSDMIVDVYRLEEEQCKKNERIRQCLMSTIEMCVFVLPPELVGSMRKSVDQYNICAVDKCPYPDRDFEQCENIMQGVRDDILCKSGYIALQCYKAYESRCESKMTGFMKGSVHDFKGVMKRQCKF